MTDPGEQGTARSVSERVVRQSPFACSECGSRNGVYVAEPGVLRWDRCAACGGDESRVQPDSDLAVLRDLVRGSEACFYDHDSACQAHHLDPKPCPYERAKQRLSEAGLSW